MAALATDGPRRPQSPLGRIVGEQLSLGQRRAMAAELWHRHGAPFVLREDLETLPGPMRSYLEHIMARLYGARVSNG